MFCKVAIAHFNPLLPKLPDRWDAEKEAAMLWLNQLVQNAIANNQPLPIEG
jgi:hypothetical protein